MRRSLVKQSKFHGRPLASMEPGTAREILAYLARIKGLVPGADEIGAVSVFYSCDRSLAEKMIEKARECETWNARSLSPCR
jgi:hypothetical protein